MAIFRFPKTTDRSLILGPTGSGKSVFGLYLLAHSDFTYRPWVIVDYKDDEQFDGLPIIEPIKKPDQKIKRPGIYIYRPTLDDEEEIAKFFVHAHKRNNVGLFFDEAQTIPFSTPLKAILQQGRSKRISVIACSQRPVGLNRSYISESQIITSFALIDDRDKKTLSGVIPEKLVQELDALPDYHSVFYDAAKRQGTILGPCPDENTLIKSMVKKHNRQYRFI